MPGLSGHPDSLRLAAFVVVLVVLAAAEAAWPRRPRSVARSRRWPVNLAIILLDTLAIRLLIPLAPVVLATDLAARGFGLFSLVGLTGPVALLFGILTLDLVIYGQHRLFHRVPVFWRLHRMHHTDLDLDVTSGTRFHPLEILLSLAIKLATVAVLGTPPQAVLLFEIILNATSMFSHANLNLPPTVDRWLRLFMVTPDMHRVHHSVRVRETDSNFGFNLPWWDRIFATYTAQPKDGHLGMTLGLREWRDQNELGLWSLVKLPFVTLPKKEMT